MAYQDASMPEAAPMSFRHMFLRSSALEQLAIGSPLWVRGLSLRLPAEAAHMVSGAWMLYHPAVFKGLWAAAA